MKKIFLIAGVCAGMAIASCTGTHQQGAGTDSPEKANDTTFNTDTVIKSTDTTSTGVDNSGSGGVHAADSTH
ncbi:MAG: hypothetical protein EOP51_16665 [Sphingobacteriales bacterium]|nr:MAG: hypothetical protein EOP51_16665 [Sphingobacteriales bacterium]